MTRSKKCQHKRVRCIDCGAVSVGGKTGKFGKPPIDTHDERCYLWHHDCAITRLEARIKRVSTNVEMDQINKILGGK